MQNVTECRTSSVLRAICVGAACVEDTHCRGQSSVIRTGLVQDKFVENSSLNIAVKDSCEELGEGFCRRH